RRRRARYRIGLTANPAVARLQSHEDARCFLKPKSTAIFVTALWLLALVQGAAAQSSNDACDLPKDLQSIVEGKYPGTKIVTISDLNEDDKQLFEKEHAGACPGLENVDFYGGGKTMLELALTKGSKASR